MQARSSRATRRRGASVILVAFLLIVPLMAMVAFAVDIGYVAVVRSEMQRAADSAALAGAAMLIDRDSLSGTVDQTAERLAARAQVLGFAVANPVAGDLVQVPENNANAPDGDLVLGYIPDRSNPTQMLYNAASYNGVRVRLRRDQAVNGPVRLFFSSLLGMPTTEVSAQAIAMFDFDIGGFKVVSDQEQPHAKLLPFTLLIDDWNAALVNGDDSYTHDAEAETVSKGGDGIREVHLYPLDNLTSGNFGTIDIGWPNNSTDDLVRQILEGPNAYDFSYYPGNELTLGPDGKLDLPGDTGISAAMKDELKAIAGQARIIPLYQTVSGTGNNAVFEIVAFAGITVLDVRLTGALKLKHVTIQPAIVIDPSATGGGQNTTTSHFVHTPLRLVQ